MEPLDQKVNQVEPVQWVHLAPWARGACQVRGDAQGPVEYLVRVVLKEM